MKGELSAHCDRALDHEMQLVTRASFRVSIRDIMHARSRLQHRAVGERFCDV